MSLKTKSNLDIDNNDTADFDGWFCIKVAPTKCRRCGQIHIYVHDQDSSRIVVWEEKDDTSILRIAGNIMEKAPQLDPRIVEYESSMGECVPYKKARLL